MDRVVRRIDEMKSGDADDETSDQLPENCRLADAARKLAEELGGDKDRDQREEEIGYRHAETIMRVSPIEPEQTEESGGAG